MPWRSESMLATVRFCQLARENNDTEEECQYAGATKVVEVNDDAVLKKFAKVPSLEQIKTSTLDAKAVRAFVNQCATVYKKQRQSVPNPNVLDLGGVKQAVVFGDIHGNYEALHKWFHSAARGGVGLPSQHPNRTSSWATMLTEGQIRSRSCWRYSPCAPNIQTKFICCVGITRTGKCTLSEGSETK